MHSFVLLAPALILAALLAAWWAGRTDAPGAPHDWRMTWWVLPACLITALLVLAMIVLQPFDPWNGARLAPPVSLRFGYALYYPAETGPVMSTVVGPMAFLAYVPVVLLPGSPADLIIAGSAWNLVLLAIPLTLWLRSGATVVLSRGERTIAGLVLMQAAIFSPALRYSVFCIHADAPAIAGLLCATMLLFASPTEPSPRMLWLAGAASILAVAAKQSLAPGVPALLGLVWWAVGARPARTFALAAAVIGGFLGVFWVARYGFQTLWSNTMAVPLLQPWMQCDWLTGEILQHITAVTAAAKLKALVAAHFAFLRGIWPFLVLLAGWWCWCRCQGRALRSLASLRCGLLTACILPGTIAGRLKEGGEVNHESFALAVLLLAVACALTEFAAAGVRVRPWLAVALGVSLLVNAPELRELRDARRLGESQGDVVFRYLRAHPGGIYFPWNPLSSLLAEGRLYHFDYGVFDRNLGGLAVSPSHLRAHLPGERPLIASFIAHHDYILHTYFPDYVEMPSVPELPGWRIYGLPRPP
jgi:hypothetical protein